MVMSKEKKLFYIENIFSYFCNHYKTFKKFKMVSW